MTSISQVVGQTTTETRKYQYIDGAAILSQLIQVAQNNLPLAIAAGTVGRGPSAIRDHYRVGLRGTRQAGVSHGMYEIATAGDWIIYKTADMRDFAIKNRRLTERGIHAITIDKLRLMAKNNDVAPVTPPRLFIDETFFIHRKIDADEIYRWISKVFPEIPIVVELG